MFNCYWIFAAGLFDAFFHFFAKADDNLFIGLHTVRMKYFIESFLFSNTMNLYNGRNFVKKNHSERLTFVLKCIQKSQSRSNLFNIFEFCLTFTALRANLTCCICNGYFEFTLKFLWTCYYLSIDCFDQDLVFQITRIWSKI